MPGQFEISKQFGKAVGGGHFFGLAVGISAQGIESDGRRIGDV